MRNTLSITQIWSDLCLEIHQKFWLLLQAILLPSLLLAFIDVYIVSSDIGLFIRLMAVIPYLLCIALVAVSCHRIILIDSDAPARAWGFYWDTRVGSYILALIVTTLCLMLVLVVLILPMMLFAKLLVPFTGPILFILSVPYLLAVAVFAYAMARISIVLPARAVGDTSSFEDLIKLSQGNGWRLTIAAVLPIFLLSFAYWPVSEWLLTSDSAAILFSSYVYGLISSLVTISLLSCSYRRLVVLRD